MDKQQLQNRINFHKSAIEGHQEQMEKDQQALEELENVEWYKRCTLNESYLTYKGEIDGYFLATETNNSNYSADADRYNNYNYFPCNKFTRAQLLTDNVPNMSKLERICYLRANYLGYEWLTEEERTSLDYESYYVVYNIGGKHFIVCDAWNCCSNKWFKRIEDAQATCDWLNAEGFDWKGDKKCQTK